MAHHGCGGTMPRCPDSFVNRHAISPSADMRWLRRAAPRGPGIPTPPGRDFYCATVRRIIKLMRSATCVYPLHGFTVSVLHKNCEPVPKSPHTVGFPAWAAQFLCNTETVNLHQMKSDLFLRSIFHRKTWRPGQQLTNSTQLETIMKLFPSSMWACGAVWERASMAWKRSSVRSRPGPPKSTTCKGTAPDEGAEGC